jgi:hypothetical protein
VGIALAVSEQLFIRDILRKIVGTEGAGGDRAEDGDEITIKRLLTFSSASCFRDISAYCCMC